jgi:hypothetical protein
MIGGYKINNRADPPSPSVQHSTLCADELENRPHVDLNIFITFKKRSIDDYFYVSAIRTKKTIHGKAISITW